MELRFGSYRLRVRERQLIGPGGPLDIDGRALDVLRALLARPNELVLKDEIFAAVWPGLVVGEDPVLARYGEALDHGWLGYLSSTVTLWVKASMVGAPSKTLMTGDGADSTLVNF